MTKEHFIERLRLLYDKMDEDIVYTSSTMGAMYKKEDIKLIIAHLKGVNIFDSARWKNVMLRANDIWKQVK